MARPYEVGSDPTVADAVRRRLMPTPAPTPGFTFQVPKVALTGPRLNVAPPARPLGTTSAPTDPLGFLKPVEDIASGIGDKVGGFFDAASQAPVVGPVLRGLNTLADATVRTPVGVAALGADTVLGTGLSGAAQRANAGRPIWELPKTAYDLAASGIGNVASDTKSPLAARLLAGASTVARTAGEFAAPVAPGIGAIKGLGKGARIAEDLTVTPPLKVDLRTAERVVPRLRPEDLRVTPKPPLALEPGAIPMGPPKPDAGTDAGFRQQVIDSIARQRDNPTPTADLANRFPVSKTDPGGGSFKYRVGDLTPVGREDLTLTGRGVAKGDAPVPPMSIDEIRSRIGVTSDPKWQENVPLDAEQLSARIGAKTRPQADMAAQTSMAIESAQAKATGTLGSSGMSGPLVGRAVGKGGSQLQRALIDKNPLDATAGDLAASLKRQAKVHDANESVINAMKAEDWPAVERGLRNVVLLGGDLGHTRARIRAAGLPAPTAAEMKRFTKAGPQSPASSLEGNNVPPTTGAPSDVPPQRGRGGFLSDEGGGVTVGNALGLGVAKAIGHAATWDNFLSLWNLPKALKATFDLSAPFRQGVLLAAGHPGEFVGAFKPMLRAAVDKRFAESLNAELLKKPRGKLYIAPLDGKLGAKEEAFITGLAGKLPGVAQSERAYVTFLNKLRVDVYDNTLASWQKGGKPGTAAEVSALGDIINHYTGRGDLPNAVKDITPALNGLFFSPRYAISRVQSIGDALSVVKQPGNRASRMAAADLVKFVGAGLTVLALAKMNGAKVEDDPRSSAFGKIQVGNRYIDIWGGSQQIARYTAQFITGQKKPLSGKSAGQIVDANRAETVQNFARGKFSPSAGAAADVLEGPSAKEKAANKGKPFQDQTLGENFVGQPFTIVDLFNPIPGQSQASLFTPLTADDIAWAAKQEMGDPAQQAAIGLAETLGVGVTSINSDASKGAPAISKTPAKTAAPGFKFQAPTAAPKKSSFKFVAPPTAAAASGGPKVQASLMAPPVGADDVRGAIRSSAQSSGIDPTLALATAYVESGFNPNAVGDNGDSHGLFQENVHGRGSGRAPDYDVARQTQRFAADVRRLLATGYTGSPGEIAAAAQRPANPQHYAQLVDAAYQRLRG